MATFDEKWDNMLKKLSEYKCKHNTFTVKAKLCFVLYNWVKVQLKLYKNGKLSRERIIKLNNIGYNFDNVECMRIKWEEMYKELINYKNEYGTLKVKTSNKQLYFWVQKQIKLYRSDDLSNEKFDKLNNIGFDFKSIKNSINWDDMYNELVEYKNKYKTTRVDSKINIKLHNWAHVQTKKYKNCILSDDRIKKLNDIKFNFHTYLSDDNWNIMYKQLLEYKHVNNTIKVNSYKNRKLYYWLRSQMKKYENNKLSKEEMLKLSNLNL